MCHKVHRCTHDRLLLFPGFTPEWASLSVRPSTFMSGRKGVREGPNHKFTILTRFQMAQFQLATHLNVFFFFSCSSSCIYKQYNEHLMNTCANAFGDKSWFKVIQLLNLMTARGQGSWINAEGKRELRQNVHWHACFLVCLETDTLFRIYS